MATLSLIAVDNIIQFVPTINQFRRSFSRHSLLCHSTDIPVFVRIGSGRPQCWDPFTDDIPVVSDFLHARVNKPTAAGQYPALSIVLLTQTSLRLCRCFIHVSFATLSLPLSPQFIFSATLCIFLLICSLIRWLAGTELVQKSFSGIACLIGRTNVTILWLGGFRSYFAIFRPSFNWIFSDWLALSSLLCLLGDLGYNLIYAVLLRCGILCWWQTIGWFVWDCRRYVISI
jgi:hypothetical protein